MRNHRPHCEDCGKDKPLHKDGVCFECYTERCRELEEWYAEQETRYAREEQP